MNPIDNGPISHGNGLVLKDRELFILSIKPPQIFDPGQNKEVDGFYIPDIKLVGYGRTQSYQINRI